jgi:hypothetical protein
VDDLKNSILVLKGENKLNSFLSTLKQQKRQIQSLPDVFSRINFIFSDGEEEINIFDYKLIILLSHPNHYSWEILQAAEKNGIITVNNSQLILKYNDCLQTQLDMQKWGFNIPKLGKRGIVKARFHEMRKNGRSSFLHHLSPFSNSSEDTYSEEFIDGELFKIKILDMQIPFVVHVENNGTNSFRRTDRTDEYPWLIEYGLKIAQKIRAPLLSIDIIVEKTTGQPFCMDINLGNALTGVNNGAIKLLTHFAHKIES